MFFRRPSASKQVYRQLSRDDKDARSPKSEDLPSRSRNNGTRKAISSFFENVRQNVGPAKSLSERMYVSYRNAGNNGVRSVILGELSSSKRSKATLAAALNKPQNGRLQRIAHLVWDATTMDAIIKGGGDVNVQDWRGLTPMHYAVLRRQPRVVEALVRAGVKIHLACDDNGRTPLHYAAAPPSSSAKLLENLRGVSDSTSANLDCLKVMLRAMDRKDVSVVDNDGNSPLHFAARAGNSGEVAELLKAGADPTLPNSRYKRPSDLAMEEGFEQTAEAILPNHPYAKKVHM